jgi:hypothetical protein
MTFSFNSTNVNKYAIPEDEAGFLLLFLYRRRRNKTTTATTTTTTKRGTSLPCSFYNNSAQFFIWSTITIHYFSTSSKYIFD